jgi:hypothetical protein
VGFQQTSHPNQQNGLTLLPHISLARDGGHASLASGTFPRLVVFPRLLPGRAPLCVRCLPAAGSRPPWTLASASSLQSSFSTGGAAAASLLRRARPRPLQFVKGPVGRLQPCVPWEELHPQPVLDRVSHPLYPALVI